MEKFKTIVFAGDIQEDEFYTMYNLDIAEIGQNDSYRKNFSIDFNRQINERLSKTCGVMKIK